MRLSGAPLTLAAYPAEVTWNPQLAAFGDPALARVFLPPGLSGLLDEDPAALVPFLEDDNRGAISPEPVATLDGIPFHLSVKGVGSAVDPYAMRPLDRTAAAALSPEAEVRERLTRPRVATPDGEPDRVMTGELWLRGSPYGGQGLAHARLALSVSERADLTSIEGFRIAPLVGIAHLPTAFEERIRTIRWFRSYRGAMAQELRLLPSNVRIYFHARQTVGQDVAAVLDRFGVRSPEAGLAFSVHFVRTAIAGLTLFARTLRAETGRGRYHGLEYHDVWLDKDAVLAPDGSIFFVDLEGIEEAEVERGRVRERIEDQLYRGLYEFAYAYETIEAERARRFGLARARRSDLVAITRAALATDPFVRLREGPAGAELEVRNRAGDEGLYTTFPLADAADGHMR